MSLQVFWFLLRPSWMRLGACLAPLLTALVSAFVSFTVVSLAWRFWQLSADYEAYSVLAIASVALLVVPLASTSGSAARMTARTLEERLSALRLLGFSAAKTRLLLIVDVLQPSLIGVIVGALMSYGTTPILGLVPLGDEGREVSLWLPWEVALIVALGLIGLSLASAIQRLNRAIRHPLQTYQRQSASRLGRLRAILTVVVAALCLVSVQFVSASWGTIGITAALIAAVLVLMATWNLLGPYLVRRRAHMLLNKDFTAAQLLAARALLEDPAAAWRHVSPVALTSFLVVPAVSALGFISAVAGGPTQLSATELSFFADIRWAVVTVTLSSFLLIACSAVVSQSAAIAERQDIYTSLIYLGAPGETLRAAHLTQLMSPLGIAVLGPSILATVALFPLVAVSTVTSPWATAVIFVCLGLGAALVQVGGWITGRRFISMAS